ncbi:MAG: GyrI-like domain-containing protein [Bacilli bacterium]|nr:GyrI-like domain-containing protein [Bacilli bacterium]
MEYKVTKLNRMVFIGFEKIFSNDNSYQEIPKYWNEIYNKYANIESSNKYKKAFIDNNIGEYAICVDDLTGNKFRYLIAGKYEGGEVLDGMVLYEFGESEWAIFDCVGPIPEALQALNTKIFKEWLPYNDEYKLNGNATIEWYSNQDNLTDIFYHSSIWIPVKRK